jgi:hypothetical protein
VELLELDEVEEVVVVVVDHSPAPGSAAAELARATATTAAENFILKARWLERSWLIKNRRLRLLGSTETNGRYSGISRGRERMGSKEKVSATLA